MSAKTILITGGLGFIGSALIRRMLSTTDHIIVNVDFQGYSSDFRNIDKLIALNKAYSERYLFFNVDLSEKLKLEKVFLKVKPDLVFHLAAESHVDRSIDDPLPFLKSNVIGTFNLLEVTRFFYKNLNIDKKNSFRLIHISTDEVFGSLGENEFFNEDSPYNPRSPYSASKAASDHFMKSWTNTFELPTIICNCSNNFGPWQFPEKLIPNIILKAMKNEKIPIYGNGLNIRDWLFIEDHINALVLIASKGEIGESYCVGGNNERTNIEITQYICSALDILKPKVSKYSELINFVQDRPGHDKRYAVSYKKIKTKLGWEPKYKFEDAIFETIKWYLKNISWCEKILKKSGYSGQRLGNSI